MISLFHSENLPCEVSLVRQEKDKYKENLLLLKYFEDFGHRICKLQGTSTEDNQNKGEF